MNWLLIVWRKWDLKSRNGNSEGTADCRYGWFEGSDKDRCSHFSLLLDSAVLHWLCFCGSPAVTPTGKRKCLSPAWFSDRQASKPWLGRWNCLTLRQAEGAMLVSWTENWSYSEDWNDRITVSNYPHVQKRVCEPRRMQQSVLCIQKCLPWVRKQEESTGSNVGEGLSTLCGSF